MPAQSHAPPPRRAIFTVGHSTHSFDDFVEILNGNGIRALADVRLFPRSRRYPHFNDEVLARELPRRGIAYLPFPELGGRRKPMPDSPNTAWRNDSFRGYADYMMTDAFRAGLARLESAAADRPTAVMCAEAVPWRCHRSLIADALLARGWEVFDITTATTAKPHAMTPFAVVREGRVVYPADEGGGLFDSV
jgi:uncharacterized protein (DUF488 family)